MPSRKLATQRLLSPSRIRAMLRAQLAAALSNLQARSPADTEIHAARKCIKRARASLRLLRDVIGRAVYQRENAALRDAARPLSATRDAKILLDVLESLTDDGAIDPTSAATLRQAMNRRRGQLKRRVLAHHDILAVRQTLRAVDRRARHWSFERVIDDSLLHALRRTFSRGRKAMDEAVKDPQAHLLHEWRKQVKYLWHQLQFLAPSSGRATLAEATHKLADHLGDDHDLAVLREYALARRSTLRRSDLKALVAAIDERRTALEKKSMTLGRRVFASKPKKFIADFVKRGRRA